jgi:formylglycine-generating enzyme required for sulfatase activity
LAWYQENSGGSTHPVGQKKPNGLSLFDMSGNVWEWCQDAFRANAYEHHQQYNPVCTDSRPDRVIRGGGWNLDAWDARCARRFSYPADFGGPALGFRLLMVLAS